MNRNQCPRLLDQFIMTSLDLVNAEAQRDDFYKLLAAKGWVKLTGVGTVWAFNKEGRGRPDEIEVIADIARVLTEAAIECKPACINFVAQVGNDIAIERVVEKRGSSYGVYEV